MEPAHRLHHLRDLTDRQRFVRTLTPDSDRYKLWLGDVVEFLNVGYGADSAEMVRLREALVSRPRVAPDAPHGERERAYLDQVDAITALLGDLIRQATDSAEAG